MREFPRRRKGKRKYWEYWYKEKWYLASELYDLPECKVKMSTLSQRLSSLFIKEIIKTRIHSVEDCLLKTALNTSYQISIQKTVKPINDNSLDDFIKIMKLWPIGSLAYKIR